MEQASKQSSLTHVHGTRTPRQDLFNRSDAKATANSHAPPESDKQRQDTPNSLDDETLPLGSTPPPPPPPSLRRAASCLFALTSAVFHAAIVPTQQHRLFPSLPPSAELAGWQIRGARGTPSHRFASLEQRHTHTTAALTSLLERAACQIGPLTCYSKPTRQDFI